MKKNLMKEFFKRDLTEAEEEQLARELATGPKKSLRFARLAEIAYLQTGLPHPSGGAGGASGSGLGGSGLGGSMTLKVIAALMVGSASVVYYVNTQSSPVQTTLPKALPALQEKMTPSLAPKPLLNSQVPSQKVGSTFFPAPLATTQPLGMVQPEAYNPDTKYDGLELVVERQTVGLVTLRVVDAAQKEIRLLYVGVLKPGKWSFQWEGKMENGDLAQPGTYQVEVQSGSVTLHKQIVIRDESAISQKNNP
jgi:hypothetical protein